MFLLRLAFWLAIVLLILPMPRGAGDAASTDGAGTEQQLSVFDALGMAQSAFSDVAHFCDRNPNTCMKGAQLAGTLKEKAKYGAELVYDYLSDEPGAEPGAGPDRLATPAGEPPAPAATDDSASAGDMLMPLRRAADTLSGQDRQISWRGPFNG